MAKYAILLMFLLPAAAHAEDCIASVYDTRHDGTRTASGIPFSDSGLTAAHKTLPFGTKVRVTNKRNGKSIEVKITDRGPYVRGRCIDLSLAGMHALGFDGVAPVTVEVVK